MNLYYLPTDIKEAAVTIIFCISAIIIFLWGRAIGVNQTTEEYKVADKNSEVLKLRRRVSFLEDRYKQVLAENKKYMHTFSAVRNQVENKIKGEIE